MDTKNKNIEQFITELCSSSPTPGGGGASAVAGSLASALGSMVANLTIGKAKYKEFEQQNIKSGEKAKQLALKMLEISDLDEQAFLPLSKAYSLPKETKEQLEHRDEVMECCLKEAAKPPFMMLETLDEIASILEQLSTTGSIIVLSDIAVGATLANSAAVGASINVLINTKSMVDAKYKTELETNVSKLVASVKQKTEKAIANSNDRLFK